MDINQDYNILATWGVDYHISWHRQCARTMNIDLRTVESIGVGSERISTRVRQLTNADIQVWVATGFVTAIAMQTRVFGLLNFQFRKELLIAFHEAVLKSGSKQRTAMTSHFLFFAVFMCGNEPRLRVTSSPLGPSTRNRRFFDRKPNSFRWG